MSNIMHKDRLTKTISFETLLSYFDGRVSEQYLRARLIKETPSKKEFPRRNQASVLAILKHLLKCSGLLKRGQQNALDIQLVANEIMLAKLPKKMSGFSIAHLSDLHIDINHKISIEIANALSQVTADICVITGDFTERRSNHNIDFIGAMKVIRNSTTIPIYAVLGNHDSLTIVPQLEAIGISVLLNEKTSVNKNGVSLTLAGIDDPHYFQTDDFSHLQVSATTVNILLAHSSEQFKQAEQLGFDLYLCGHTHGGQVCLPGNIPIINNARSPRKYCRGNWQFQQLKGYTSSGTGTSNLDIRFNCPATITLHKLLTN